MFDVENTPAYYGVLGFPFKKTADFIDLRVHSISYFEKVKKGLKYLLIINIVGFGAYMSYVLYKK